MLIIFSVNDQKITHDLKGQLVAGSVDIVQAAFKFDSSWDELDKIVVFTSSACPKPVPVQFADEAFYIPKDVLKPVIDGKMDAADSMTTEAINSAIATAIAKSAHARFEKVEKVPSNDEAQDNVLYLVMNTTTKHYDIYAKIKGSSDSYTMELLDDTTVDLSGKVDKVAGKGLSTNDYTTAEKTKLAGIAEGANKYVHPSYTAKTSGLYKVTVDATGHVSAVAAVTKGDITALGIPGQDTTYPEATTAKAGLMSAADKSKLDGMTIATDAEVSEMLTEVFGATA